MKNIAILGATSGIGAAVATYLAQEQYDLFLLGRNVDKLSNLLHELTNSAIKVSTFLIDYAQEASITDFVTKVDDLQLQFSGAVIITPRPEMTDSNFPGGEYWETLFNNCFIQPLKILESIISCCLPKSKIVIVSGISSIQAIHNHASAFSVLRMMWLAQAKSLANELGPRGIQVNTLSPGGVLTESAKVLINQKAEKNNRSFEEQYNESVSNVPLRKYAEPEEIAAMVEFLLSDKASHLTGLNIACDGGFIQSY